MAEIKEREIIKVSSGTSTKKKTTKASPDTKKKNAEAATTKHALISAADRKKAIKFRIIAAVMWLLAIVAEVLTVLVTNKTIYFGENILTFILIGLGIDLAFVIAGSLLWKKSNRLDPASEKNKLKFFLWNNMGLFAAIICFVPLIIILLKQKDLDPKVKKIASIVAIVVAVIAGLFSVDWNPVSAEDIKDAQTYSEQNFIGDVFWTPFGKCYHLDENCSSLSNSPKLYTGTLAEATDAKRGRPCSFCASEEDVAALNGTPISSSDLDDLADMIGDSIAEDSNDESSTERSENATPDLTAPDPSADESTVNE